MCVYVFLGPSALYAHYLGQVRLSQCTTWSQQNAALATKFFFCCFFFKRRLAEFQLDIVNIFGDLTRFKQPSHAQVTHRETPPTFMWFGGGRATGHGLDRVCALFWWWISNCTVSYCPYISHSFPNRVIINALNQMPVVFKLNVSFHYIWGISFRVTNWPLESMTTPEPDDHQWTTWCVFSPHLC